MCCVVCLFSPVGLLLDRLFAFGYRRVQICVDSQDVRGKRLPNRLGFTQEGEILKHMIVKDANRDSLIYGMLNSDWDYGARAFVFRKVHGDKMQKIDAAIVSREEVDHEQGERAKSVKRHWRRSKVESALLFD